jgi:hypothetical protein
LLGYVLHEVRQWVPEFIIITGPLISEREGHKYKDEYLKYKQAEIVSEIRQYLKNIETKVIYVPDNDGKDPNIGNDKDFL